MTTNENAEALTVYGIELRLSSSRRGRKTWRGRHAEVGSLHVEYIPAAEDAPWARRTRVWTVRRTSTMSRSSSSIGVSPARTGNHGRTQVVVSGSGPTLEVALNSLLRAELDIIELSIDASLRRKAAEDRQGLEALRDRR